MSRWRVTAALSRALVVGAVAVALAVLTGRPVLLVLAAPVVVVGILALGARPRGSPVLTSAVDHQSLREGQVTTSRLQLTGGDHVEHVTRVAAPVEHLEMRPGRGRTSGWVQPGPDGTSGLPDLFLRPRRWGRRQLGRELVALTSPWAGYRWGPVELPGTVVRVLPEPVVFGSRAESPQPQGLVGSHRSSRPGSGTELAGIREFHPGDRLRRINWRVSARTGRLHVTTTRAEQDSGILLVVDALADHGRSGGVDGEASSLDLTVRAAAAVAEHAVRLGDRVALRVVSGAVHPRDGRVGFGTGRRHLRRVLETLAAVQVGEPRGGERWNLQVTAGTTVVLLSPVLNAAVGTAAATSVRRGLPTLVIDTLPPTAVAVAPEAADPRLAELAWRMRRVERSQVLAALGALGCPVVAWRGPGTLDDVLRRLARRAELPRVVAR